MLYWRIHAFGPLIRKSQIKSSHKCRIVSTPTAGQQRRGIGVTYTITSSLEQLFNRRDQVFEVKPPCLTLHFDKYVSEKVPSQFYTED